MPSSLAWRTARVAGQGTPRPRHAVAHSAARLSGRPGPARACRRGPDGEERVRSDASGPGSLEICAAPWLGAQLLQRSYGDVHDRLLYEAQRLLRRPIEGVIGRSVIRIPEGVPLFYIGWLRRLRDRPEVGHQYPVVAAGDWLASPRLEGAVRSGVAAAAAVLERAA